MRRIALTVSVFAFVSSLVILAYLAGVHFLHAGIGAMIMIYFLLPYWAEWGRAR